MSLIAGGLGGLFTGVVIISISELVKEMHSRHLQRKYEDTMRELTRDYPPKSDCEVT